MKKNRNQETQGVKVEQSVTIFRPVQEVYKFWQNVENLPKFINHLKAVHKVPDDASPSRSHWVASTRAGLHVEWDVEIINERENEIITWQSLPGSEVDAAGSVRFKKLSESVTEVQMNLNYEPPGGKMVVILSKLFRKDAASEIEEDLEHVKRILEAAARMDAENYRLN